MSIYVFFNHKIYSSNLFISDPNLTEAIIPTPSGVPDLVAKQVTDDLSKLFPEGSFQVYLLNTDTLTVKYSQIHQQYYAAFEQSQETKDRTLVVEINTTNGVPPFDVKKFFYSAKIGSYSVYANVFGWRIKNDNEFNLVHLSVN